MKDFDLESKVKAVRVPERDEDYWEAFPHRMMTELRSVPWSGPCGGRSCRGCCGVAGWLWPA